MAQSLPAIPSDPVIEANIQEWLKKMTLEEKIGQMCEKPLTEATVKAALRVAPCVVVKERGQKLLEALGCTEILGGRYSRVKYGIRRR